MLPLFITQIHLSTCNRYREALGSHSSRVMVFTQSWRREFFPLSPTSCYVWSSARQPSAGQLSALVIDRQEIADGLGVQGQTLESKIRQ